MAINRIFRTCPSTGLKIHRPAENLIKANAVAAVVFLAVVATNPDIPSEIRDSAIELIRVIEAAGG